MGYVDKSAFKVNQAGKQVVVIDSDTDESTDVRYEKREGSTRVDRPVHRPIKQRRRSSKPSNHSRWSASLIESDSDDEVMFMGANRVGQDPSASQRFSSNYDLIQIPSESEDGHDSQEKMQTQRSGLAAEVERTPSDALQKAKRPPLRHHSPHWKKAQSLSGYSRVDVADHSSIGEISPGDSVRTRDGDYLRVMSLHEVQGPTKQGHSSVKVSGILLQSCENMGGLFSSLTGELIVVVEKQEGDTRSDFQAGLEVVGLDEIDHVCKIVLTNAPTASQRLEADTTPGTGLLICSWKHVICYGADGKDVLSEVYAIIDQKETDDGHALSNVQLDRRWRSTAKQQSPTSVNAIDLCCGAGGASQGMKNAGLALGIAIDNEKCATATYRKNHPEAQVIEGDASDFVMENYHGRITCDILHASVPCQPWSSNHTRAGKDDDANTAMLFVIGPAVECFRPRIVTLEQTDGLPRRHWPQYCALINQLVDQHYSVHSKVCNFADTGNPQARRRLWIYAVW